MGSGLCGETGKVADLYKKHLFQGHELDRKAVAEELGDVLWYAAELATGLGMTLDKVAEINIAKLRKRYPNGFESRRSVERDG